MGRLFGTDGARGIANKELTCELATNIGRAAAYVLTEKTTEKPKVLIGKDTRVSSNMLEMALAAGLCSVGINVYAVRVIVHHMYICPEPCKELFGGIRGTAVRTVNS